MYRFILEILLRTYKNKYSTQSDNYHSQCDFLQTPKKIVILAIKVINISNQSD